jgi:putative drug exporter of the RND superfamily
VFSIFIGLHEVELKVLGVGLATAVLLDATVVRGVLLPAAMTLLGDRCWYLPGRTPTAADTPENRLPAGTL